MTWQLYVAAPHMSAYLMDFLLLRVCTCLASTIPFPMSLSLSGKIGSIYL